MSNTELQNTFVNEDFAGWIPDEFAEPNATWAAFDKSVGGAAEFNGDYYESLLDGSEEYDANKLPPIVSWESLKPYLLDIREKHERRRAEGLIKLPHEIYADLGINKPALNQGSYNSCAPVSENGSIEDRRAKVIGNRGAEFEFVETNGWYGYIGSAKYSNSRMSGGRTMASPVRFAREVGMFRSEIVGTYEQTAGTWSIDTAADPMADKLQACYCYLGDLKSAEEHAKAVMLALECELTSAEGSDRKVVFSTVNNGYPIGEVGGSTMHAQGSRGVLDINGVRHILKRNSWGKLWLNTNVLPSWPGDTLCLSLSEFTRYIGGRYRDGILVVYAEAVPGKPKKGGLPDIL